MRILTWNLKNWPSVNGLPTEDDKAAIDAEAFSVIEQLQAIDNPIDRSIEKNKLVDFQRADKLLEILLKLSELPEVIFFQEVTSKNFIEWVVGSINEKKGSQVYNYVAHFNEPKISQGLSIVSKYEITEMQKVDIGNWLREHPRTNSDASDLDKDSENLEKFIRDKPELGVAIGGGEAWGTVVNLAPRELTGLRPLFAAKLNIDGYPVWCINVHLKSNLPMWGAFGFGKSDSHDDTRKKMAAALNKSLREIYAHTIVGFSKFIEINEKPTVLLGDDGLAPRVSSFILAGDFNTVSSLDKENMLFKDEQTISILTSGGFKKVENTSITFNDLEDPSKSWDIDHVFIKGNPNSYLANKTGSAAIIDVTIKENKVEYPVIEETFKDTVQHGRRYVIPKELLIKPGGLSSFVETSLFLAKKDTRFFSSTAVLKPNSIVNLGPSKKYKVDSSASNNKELRTVNIGSTDGNIVFTMNGKCKLKEMFGKETVSTVTDITGKDSGASFFVDSKGFFESSSITDLPKKFTFDPEVWEQVYSKWSRRTFWKDYKIVIDGVVYNCIEAHKAGETDNISDPEYLKRYWTKFTPVELGILSDHNGLLVSIT